MNALQEWDEFEAKLELPEFRSFPKIPRLVQGVVVTEKLDGTNSSVLVGDDGRHVATASRNRWIFPGKTTDNHGFAAYVQDNLEMFEALGPGHHFGEWWGQGVARTYDLAEKRFSLFNTSRWTAETLPVGLHVVPVLYEGPSLGEGTLSGVNQLRYGGSMAAPGFMNPEGIVVFFTKANTLMKYTLDGDGHKGVSK